MLMIAAVPRIQARWKVSICSFLAMGAIGCVGPTFDETYYVGVYKGGSNQPLQFYRFKMKGRADFGSRTKFESGWYPAAAIEQAVGESRPLKVFRNSLANANKNDDPSKTACSSNDRVVVVGPEGETKVLRGQRLAIFMAADPGPMTNSIAAFAKNLDAQLSAQLIAIRARRTERNAAAKEQRRLRAKSLLASMKDAIPGGSDSDGLRKVLDVFINQLGPMPSDAKPQPGNGAS